MKIDKLLTDYQYLYHMAEDGSWENILKHGLLSTSALLDKWGYSGRKREEIEIECRREKKTICHPEFGEVVIRDQKVMPPESLDTCLLANLKPRDWYKLINGKIFFWAKKERLGWFLGAQEYKNSPHVVIKVDTSVLLNQYANRIRLTNLNTGSTISRKPYPPKKRGLESFQRIEDFSPFSEVVELAIDYGIPDIVSYAISVTRWIAHKKGYEAPVFEKLEDIWINPLFSESDEKV